MGHRTKPTALERGQGWRPESALSPLERLPGTGNCIDISSWRGAFERARTVTLNQIGGRSLSRPTTAAAPLLDDLAAAIWVQAYEAAWLGRKWERLHPLLAPEVEFVVPGAPEPIVGNSPVVAALREKMMNVRIHEYNATDLKGYGFGSVGVVTYRWQLDWTPCESAERTQCTGRDVLVLRAAAQSWLLVWRGQFRS